MYTRDLFSRILVASSLTTVVTGYLGRHHRRQDGPVPTGTIKDCTYFVVAHAGDTCTSIATAWGISQVQFLNYNPSVGPNCAGLVIGDSYCVEENFGLGPLTTSTPTPTLSTKKSTNTSATTTAGPSPTQSGLAVNCNAFYKVVSGDTCQKIVDSYGTFALSDFYLWNPAVGSNCANLQLGVYVCVGVPRTTSHPSSTTSSGAPAGPSPTQSGIISTCTKYYQAVSGDTCDVITRKYGTFSVAQFEAWNPAVGSTCSTLFLGYYYCVGVAGTPTSLTSSTSPTSPPSNQPLPTQTGIVSNCNNWYKAVSGDTCQVIVDKYKTFTVDTFESWNPAVGSTCNQLLLGYYYCTGTTTSTSVSGPPVSSAPQPQQPGIASNCKQYYLVSSGDTCAIIESKKGVTSANFFSWNKGIKSDCSNLFLGYYVCVGV